MSDFQNEVRDRIISRYKDGVAGTKGGKAATPKVKKEEDFNAVMVAANPDPIWYSDIFVGGKEYLDKTTKIDLDIAAIYNQRSDWGKEHVLQIPALDDTYVWQHDVLYTALIAMLGGLKTLMVGGTGTGKTSFYTNLAASLNQPFYRLGGRGDMESDSILGRPDIQNGSTSFLLGEFPKALTNGYLILFDEIWKLPAAINMTLQRILERGGILQIDEMPGDLGDKQFFPHDKTYIALADNVVGTGDGADKYVATQIQDASSLNRVDMVLRLDYLQPQVEVDMLEGKYDFLPNVKAYKMVQLANLIRQAHDKGQLEVTISPRNLMAWAELAYKMQNYADGFRYTMLERYADEGEKSTVRGFYQTVFGDSL